MLQKGGKLSISDPVALRAEEAMGKNVVVKFRRCTCVSADPSTSD